MSWEVFAASTLTGSVGPRLEAVSGSWNDIVNDPTDLRARVSTPWLLSSVERWLWSPWSGSLLICYEGQPIGFGPITKEPTGDPDFTDLEAGGLWSLLDERVVTPGNMTDGDALAKATLSLTEGSLGTIAARLVEFSQKRPAGWFPIRYASPQESGTNRVRNYEGFNIGNNSVGKRLREITQVINGPDIAFRPEWVPGEEGNRVQWAMYHGTEAMPYIKQSHYYTIDLTAPRSNTVAARVTAEHTPYGRVYASGAGQDEGTIIRINTAPVRQYVPLLETTISDTQTENVELLDSRAQGILRAGRLVQITAEINDPTIPMHTLWAGDEVQVVWPSGWPQLDAGVYRMRVLSRSGNLDSPRMSVEFQTIEEAI